MFLSSTYFKITFIIAFFITISFVIVSALQFTLLEDPNLMMKNDGLIAALSGILLLIADVLLPVPSSLVMIANGALFGFITGAILSMIGGVGAGMFGLYLGKGSSSFINKFISNTEQERAKKIMEKYGMISLIVTRCIPVLSETVSIVAGMTNVSPFRMFLASLLGLAPAVLIYAFTGAYAVEIDNGIYSFLLVIIIAGLFWILNKAMFKSK